MAEVVQATCPGCKAVLRIPGNWLGQPVRCKSCGTVMQARKQPDAPARGPVPPPPPPVRTGDTPVPAKRMPAVPPPPPAPALVLPPPSPQLPPASPRAPAASPVYSRTASSFDFEEPLVESPSPRRRRRQSNGGLWVGVSVLVVAVLAVAGLGYAFRAELGKAFDKSGHAGLTEDDVSPEKDRKGGKKGTAPANASFPRRALLIGVHNYLYANPIIEAPDGDDERPNTARLVRALNTGLRIPLDQIVEISDAARNPVPPLRSVIEEGLKNFLSTCRKQDRIMVFFVGHTKEIDNQAYLVPLEGELDSARTLIPLTWVYQQLAECPARQKVFVLDGNRFNASQGEERPASGPMGKKFAEALSRPPAGVQVWASCSAEQLSYEVDTAPLGLFLESFRQALAPKKGEGALAGRIQKHDDLIPVDTLHQWVSARLSEETGKRKLKQVATLAGSPPADGAEYDAEEDAPKRPALPVVKSGDLRAVQEIMNEISVPPLKGGEFGTQDLSFSILPPFPPEALKAYQGGQLPADSKLRKAIHNARVILWAISGSKPPADLAADVPAIRARIPDLSIMKDRYAYPGEGAAETAFKNRIFEDSKGMARIVARMESVLEELKEAGDEVETAPKRWQANYKFILARFQAQLAYLEEYQGLLGGVRKELPPLNKEVEAGWRMAAKEKPGDGASRKYDKAVRKLYVELAEAHPDTPWEVLGKREKLTALGLEWQPY